MGGGALEPACRTLNEALSMRTFLAGYSLSVADMAIWGQLQGDARLPSSKQTLCSVHLSQLCSDSFQDDAQAGGVVSCHHADH